MKVLAWIIGVPVLVFVIYIWDSIAKSGGPSIKRDLERAAEKCFVEKAQARMPDTECRSLRDAARGL